MAQPAQRKRRTDETARMTQAQIDQQVIRRLTESGYTNPQARQILSLAKPLARGRRVTIPVGVDEQEVMRVTRTLNRILNEPNRARELLATELSVRGPRPEVTLRAVPTPVREFRSEYTVAIDGRRYRIEANQDLRWSGVITRPDQTAGGRLLNYLRDAPAGDFRITEIDESGRPLRTDANGRAVVTTKSAFLQRAQPVYGAITNEFATAREQGRVPDADVIGRITMTYVSLAERETRDRRG